MDLDQLPDHIVYSKNVIEFVTVAAETCLFLEHATDFSREDFVVKSVKLFPLLYLKASLIDIPASVFDEGWSNCWERMIHIWKFFTPTCP